MPIRAALRTALILLAWPGLHAGAEDAFEIVELPSPGRSVAGEIADLDGDGRQDLLEIAFVGIPPEERRLLRVRFGRPEGGYAERPDLERAVPAGSAVYDLDDVSGGPGRELLLLEATGVRVLAFEGGLKERRVVLPGVTTIGAGADERGLDRHPLTTRALGSEPRLVLPGLGEIHLASIDGAPLARLEVGGRSNYFVQPPGPTLTESDIQLFYDVPRLQFGDVDGDGRVDAVAASRHEMRVFLRREDGRFDPEPSRHHWLARVGAEDHVRGSGAVRTVMRDLDADGLGDLVIGQISGGILDSRSVLSVYLNQGSGWSLDAPSAVFDSESSVSAFQVLDLDADGRLELLRLRVPVTVLELVEILVTRSFDALIAAYGVDAEGRFDSEPRFERKLGLPINFKTSRIRGFVPTFDHDLNADGFPDLLTSGDGDRIDVYLGGRDSRYADRAASQPLPTEGRLRAGDVDGDGLPDLLLYSTRRMDVPLRVGRNLGRLPGTPPRLQAAPDDRDR